MEMSCRNLLLPTRTNFGPNRAREFVRWVVRWSSETTTSALVISEMCDVFWWNPAKLPWLVSPWFHHPDCHGMSQAHLGTIYSQRTAILIGLDTLLSSENSCCCKGGKYVLQYTLHTRLLFKKNLRDWFIDCTWNALKSTPDIFLCGSILSIPCLPIGLFWLRSLPHRRTWNSRRTAAERPQSPDSCEARISGTRKRLSCNLSIFYASYTSYKQNISPQHHV